MMKYRRKPKVIEVEAQRFDSSKPRHEWPFGVRWIPEEMEQDGSRVGGLHIVDTLGGFLPIRNGDWVVYRDGERSVMRNTTFRATYEEIQ